MDAWKKVLCTHEEAQRLSTGPWLGDNFPGVALPSEKALYKWIMIRCGEFLTCAQVVDVGPFCLDDDAYIFGSEKPRAQIYKGQHCPMRKNDDETMATLPDGTPVLKSNGSGIDIFPYTARQLHIAQGINTEVEWRFVYGSEG